MDEIQKVLVRAGRRDLAKEYYRKISKKWIGEVVDDPGFDEGALRKYFGVGEGETISMSMINAELKKLKEKYKDKPYSKSDLKLLRRLNFAKNVMKR